MTDIPDLPPNPDGTTATAVLNLYMTNQIIPNCTKIFAGGNIPDELIVNTRARFQDVNKLIAQILGDLPSE